MGKAKRRKSTRVRDLAAKKTRDVRGGKKTADETVDDGKDKASGSFWGSIVGSILK